MDNDAHIAQARPGLRERKKAQTRTMIAETAKRMFGERGFDAVTVADIADAANVSVKTLFKYFKTKEDMLFNDEDGFRDEMLDSIRNRPPGDSALDAIHRQFKRHLSLPEGPSVVADLEAFRRTFEENRTVQARLTLMWERYEIALAELLAIEADAEPYDPSPRLVAAQLVSLFRLFTSGEVHRYVGAHAPEAKESALARWLDRSIDLVGNGVKHYAVRPKP